MMKHRMRKSSTTLKTNESKKSLTRQHGVLAPKTHAIPLLLSSHHLALNRQGRRGTTDDFTTSFLHFTLFSTAPWDLANSRPVHSLMLSSSSSSSSSSVCLVFFPLSLCLAICLPMDGRHVYATAVCGSLRWSGGLRVARLQ